jgi:signal transduction histidine kinase
MDKSPVAVHAGLEILPIEAAVLDSEGEIVLVNDAWRRFADENHSAHPDHWVGENYLTISERAFPDEVAEAVVAGLQALAAGDRDRFQQEYPCHSPTAQQWFELDAITFTDGGERFVLVLHRESTDRKLARQRAEARATQLETMLGVLTHDIRNPLNVIAGYASTLESEYDDERLGQIRSATERIAEITDATLEFSRAGALSTVAAIDLEALARDAWTNVETADATLTVTGTTRLYGDRRLLMQLFENLFRNAVEHVGPPVAVTVEPLPDGFFVADDGPGLPADIREKVLDIDLTNPSTGGLGLAIVQAVTKAHGGTLDITEAEGGGARFEFTGFDETPD